jgi:hypothetical protein
MIYRQSARFKKAYLSLPEHIRKKNSQSIPVVSGESSLPNFGREEDQRTLRDLGRTDQSKIQVYISL